MSDTKALSIRGVVTDLVSSYRKNTSTRLKLIDSFLVTIFLIGVIQFVYCVIVGTFPFNSFLSGFIAAVGSFVLTVSLRMQVNPKNADRVSSSPERAFADYVFAHIVLFVAVFSFMG